MNKKQILNLLEDLYERALNVNELHLCFKILQEMTLVNQFKENTRCWVLSEFE